MSFNLSQQEYEFLQKTVFGQSHSKRSKAPQEDEVSSTDIYLQQAQKPAEQGFFADVVDSIQMGAWQGASDLARGLGAIFDSDWLNKTADWAARGADDNMATMSSKMRDALGQSAFDGFNDETGEGKGILNAYWWAGNLGSLIGQNLDAVVTLGAGKLATTGVKMAGKAATNYFTKQTAEQIGNLAVKEAAKRGAPNHLLRTIGLTAVQSAMGAGSRANQVRDEIDELGDEKLAQLEGFRQTYWDLKNSEEGQNLDHNTLFDEAKERFKFNAGRNAALDLGAIATDLSVNAISGLGGGVWGAKIPPLGNTQSVRKGILKGVGIEAGTEAIQGGVEQRAINETAQQFYDPTRDINQDVSRNAIDGAILGGAFGGAMGGIEARSHRNTMNREKKRLLEAVSTGDERVDEQIRAQVEAYNRMANELEELISPQRLQQLNQYGQQAVEKIKRREQIEAELSGEPQAQITTETANIPYHQRNLAELQAEFIQNGFDENDFNDFIEANLQQATADLQNLQTNPFRMGADLQKGLAEKQAYNAKLADAQARVNFFTQAKNAPKFGTEPVGAEVQAQSEPQVDLDGFKFSRSAMKSVEANIARGREAMTKAILDKSSVHRAMYNHELGGWVDFEWGDTGRIKPNGKTVGGMGISHILESRVRKDGLSYEQATRMLTDNIVETIARGEITSVREVNNSQNVRIAYNGYQATLAKSKGSNAWIVTAFELFEDANRKGYDKSIPTNTSPTLPRADKGASNLASDSGQLANTNGLSNDTAFELGRPTSTSQLNDTHAHSQRGRGVVAESNVNLEPFANDVKFSRSAPQDYVRDLMVTHNITPEGILHAQKMGGLPYASVAVAKQDNPLTGFGDVTLIGDRHYIDPKGENKAKVFGADIESKRYDKQDSRPLEQIAADLKLSYLRASSGNDNSLVRSIAKASPEFTSIEEIQQNKSRLVSRDEYNQAYDQANAQLVDLARTLGINYNQTKALISSLSHPDVAASMDVADLFFDEYGIDNNDKNRQAVSDMLNTLVSMPTEYFEGKAKDITQFSDFKGAVIPQNLDPAVRQVLAQSGLPLYEYDRTNPSARAEIIKQASNELDILHNGDVLFSRAANKPERLEKLHQSQPIEITGTEIKPSNDIREYKRNALEYGKSLRGSYVNKDTGKAIELGAGGVKEILQHDYKDIEHLQSIAAIPQIIENAIYIDTLPNEENGKNFAIDKYEYYLAGLKIGGVDYTVKAVIGVSKDGDRYYDHKLTKIEKGELLSLPSRITNPVGEGKSPLSEINDKRLLQILQPENQPFDFTHEKSQIATAVGKGLSRHFDVVHSAELGIDDPSIEAAYNTKTGKIVIIADNIRANSILSREERLKWVAWHELAHRGLQVRFGGEFRDLMQTADRNSTVNALATALQKDRSELKDNRILAVEEAIAELHAAYTTGKMEELKSRYGLEIPLGKEKSLKAWFKMTAERIREVMAKLFGLETANRFSHDDLLNLLKDIQQNAGGDVNGVGGDIRHSLNEDPNSSFAKAVDTVSQGGKPSQQYIPMGTTPDVLKMLGVKDMNVTIHRDVLNKVMGDKHNVTADTLKQLPNQINHPVAVMKSAPQATQQGYVVLTELIEENAVTGQKEPVISALHLKATKDGIEVINIASVYGKNLRGLQNMLNHDLLYWNNKKGSQFVEAFGLQLPSKVASNNVNHVGNIKTEADLSQYQNSDLRFSRSSSYLSGDNTSVLNLARGGNIKAKKWTDNFSTIQALKETFKQGTAKLDEWFADSLRPVNDWIDQMQFSDHTSNVSGRDHEKRRLKDAMYTAKGKRDALNSELEVNFLKPILSKIAQIAKQSNGKINEETAKAKAGYWVSARYSIEKNHELLTRDQKAVQDAQDAFSDAQINGSSEDIRKAKNVLNQAQTQYAERQRAVWNQDFNNKNFKVGVAGGWSIPEAQEIMREIERDISVRDLNEIGDLIADLNQARLDIDKQSGRYTDAEYQQFKANRNYVPLTGDPDAQLDDMDFIAGAGSNALNIGKDKSLQGRTNSEAEDAIDAVWKAVGKSTTYAGWSEFKGKLDELFETEVSLLEQQGLSRADAQRLASENLGIGKQKMQGLTRSSDNVLIAKRGGTYYEYSLPDKVISALKNDNVEQANDFLKVLSKPTSWYARGVTQWTLTFAPINMLRDTWEKSEFIRVQKVYDQNGKLLDSRKMDQIGRATALSAFSNRNIWAATKRLAFGQELRDSIPEEKLLKQLLKEGGVSNYGTYLERTEADLLKRIKRENSSLGSKIDKAFGVLESYNKTFDMVSALSAYKALVDNGVDSKQAAAATLSLTNFRKTGSKMRGIKALYMFSQPTVMGASNLLKFLSTRKGQIRFVAYFAGMIALYSALRSMDDEDETGNKMDQLGDITRFIPIPTGTGDYIKIPVGFGMPQMAWNFATNIVKGSVSDISFMEAGVNMVTHATKTFAPVSPSEISAAKYPLEKLALTFTPSILQPLMQNALNRSAFGSQITTNFVRQDKLKAEQSKSTTAQFWKDLAVDVQQTLGFDMHPEQIKNLVDGYSGMLGSLRELSTIFVENPNREQLGRNTRMPFINQLFGAGNEFAVQSRYYEASEVAQQVAKEYAYRKANKSLDREWLTPERQNLIKWHEHNLSSMGKLRSEKAQLTKLLRAGKISAHAYEQRLKRYNEAVHLMQSKLLSSYRQMEGLSRY